MKKKKEKNLPEGLKKPLGTIAQFCSGRRAKDFHNCQRVLARSCLPLHRAFDKEPYADCLAQKLADLEKGDEDERYS